MIYFRNNFLFAFAIIASFCIIILNSYGISDEENFQIEEINKNFVAESKKLGDLLIRYHTSLKFFEEKYDKVNLDGLFGVRISEGIFQNIIT